MGVYTKVLEAAETQNLIRLQKSKLDSLNQQLSILLRKKARLEVEIQSVKKAISKRKTHSEKKIRVALNLENDQPLFSNKDVVLESSERSMVGATLEDFYRSYRESQLLLEEYSDLQPN